MPLDERYFVWLYSRVGDVQTRNQAVTYWKLLRILYTTRFTWSKRFEKDGNRAQDGKTLREEYVRETGDDVDLEEWMGEDCSMLEMLIALSWRLAFDGEGEPSDWFWILIDNIGLVECTDANPPDEGIVQHILTKIVRRDYAPNGAGGLFPLEHPDKDQRKVELWYQAQAFLLERL